MKELSASEIYNLLKKEILSKNIKGHIYVDFAGLKYNIETKDVMGGLLQEWLEKWMINRNVKFTKPPTQEFPDFILHDNSYLEVKSFDSNASPNFDVANFDAYTRSLLTCPQRLDADYLIFSYRLYPNYFEIENIWLKKVWEITGFSKKNCLNLQVKQEVPVNIRPKKWYGGADMFKNRKEFVDALNNASIKFERQKAQNWEQVVAEKYKEVTGHEL